MLKQVKSSPSEISQRTRGPSNREVAQAKYDREWFINPEQFHPARNGIETLRLSRTQALLKPLKWEGKTLADLGCGFGSLAHMAAEKGAFVTALDISSIPLKRLEGIPSIETKQQYVPFTTLPDQSYDLVLALDLIALLPKTEYRLFFSEIARLVKPDGWVVVSTPLDIDSENPVDKFIQLARSELTDIELIFSYHAWSIRLLKLLKGPEQYFKAYRDPSYFHKKLENRGGLGKKWFRLATSAPLAYGWGALASLLKPLTRKIENSTRTLQLIEKACQFFLDQRGINHLILIGKRKPLFEPLDEEDTSQHL